MEEYYKIRYNLYKYFMNVDSDTYARYIYIYGIIIFTLGILLPIFLISIIKNINVYMFIFLIFLILYYYISYKLYIYLLNIPNNNELKSYKLLYEILNIIYRENKDNQDIDIKNKLKYNIRNIENKYDDKIIDDIILKSENNNDILKYYDIDNYLMNDKPFSLIYKSDNIKSFLYNIGGDNSYYIYKNNLIEIKLNILFDENMVKNDNIIDIQNKLLKYINKKYNKNLSTLYINPNINDDKYLYKDLIKSLKSNIIYYTIISFYFILLILHGLFINMNITLIYMYILIIIIAIFIMYYYN